MIRRLGLALVALVAVVGATTPPAGGEEDEPFKPPGLIDPVPETLIEPPPTTRALKVTADSARTVGFCDVMRIINRLPEPNPEDPDELLKYTKRHIGAARVFDPSYKVPDPARRGRQTTVGADVRDAFVAERAALWAFQTRVQYAEQLRDAKEKDKPITEGEFRRLLKDASVRLVDSRYSAADRTLQRAQGTYCS